MSRYLSDEEQAALVKRFARHYGPSILLGLLLAVGVSFGWRYWVNQRDSRLEQASTAYSQLLESVLADKGEQAKKQGEVILSHYASSPYAPMSRLLLAREAIQSKNFDGAVAHLQWVIQHTRSGEPLQSVTRLRLARLFLFQKQYDKALSSLSAIRDSVFLSASEVIQGDILLAQGKKTAARQAYQSALKGLPRDASLRPLLAMKVDDLATHHIDGEVKHA